MRSATPNVCIRCHHAKDTPGAWCETCHPLAVKEAADPMLRIGDQDRPPLPPGAERGIVRFVYIDASQPITGRQRRHHPLDRRRALIWTNSPSPSWENIIRAIAGGRYGSARIPRGVIE
jgi:hypothetical protein